MNSNRPDGSARRVFRWTPERHDRFVEAVNRLGGPDTATPEDIWKEMKAVDDSELTIFVVISHFQKYRATKLIRESTTGDKFS